MLLLFISAILILVGYFLEKKDRYFAGGIICMAVGSLALFIGLLGLLLNPIEYRAKASQLQAFKETVEFSRTSNVSELERAAILSKIGEWNEWLAETKYYNESIFGLWIPDEVAQIEPIR